MVIAFFATTTSYVIVRMYYIYTILYRLSPHIPGRPNTFRALPYKRNSSRGRVGYACRWDMFLLFSSSKYLDRCKGSENLGYARKFCYGYFDSPYNSFIVFSVFGFQVMIYKNISISIRERIFPRLFHLILHNVF